MTKPEPDPTTATRSAANRLASEVTSLHRMIAFFGDGQAPQKLMQQIASTCFRPDHADSPAYFGPDLAHRLRSIIHLATWTQAGLCPKCLEQSDARA